MTLERKYRRLTRLFPAKWRRQHEEELIGTLLDATEPGRDSVAFRDAADLVRSAAVLRVRALLAAPTHLVGFVALGLLSAFVTGSIVRAGLSDISVEFLVTSLVVVLVPGTGVVYTVSSAIGGGLRRGLFAAIGCTFGIVPHVLAALLGLSGIMQAGAVAFETVRWLGVVCLIFMGLSMIRDRGALDLRQPENDQDATADPMGVVVRRGVVVNLLNPKLTLFFFAFLPQFLDSPPGLLDPRLVGLGGVFMLMTLGVFGVYAWASAAVRDRVLSAPGVLRWFQRSLGTLLIGFAARLAVSDR